MVKTLWDSIHYLYDDTNISYTQLLGVAQKAEIEVMDSKVSSTTSKAGLGSSSSSEEIQTLTRQIPNLLSMVQGAQQKGGKSKNQGNGYNNRANTKSVVNESGNQSKTANQPNNCTYPKHTSTSAGPSEESNCLCILPLSWVGTWI